MVFSCLGEVFGCYIYSILFFSLSAFKIFLCITGFEQFDSYLLYAVLFVFLVLGFCWICGFEVVVKLDSVRSLTSFFLVPCLSPFLWLFQLHVCEATRSVLYVFLNSFFSFSVCFILDSFHCCLFKFTNLSFSKDNLSFIPSSTIIISDTVAFICRGMIQVFFFLIHCLKLTF